MPEEPQEAFDLDLERLVGRYSQRLGQAELDAEVAAQQRDRAIAERDELARTVEALEARIADLEVGEADAAEDRPAVELLEASDG